MPGQEIGKRIDHVGTYRPPVERRNYPSKRTGRPVASATGLGQSETNVTTEPWSAVEWIADTQLTRASILLGIWFYICRNPPSACQVRGRAIPCSDCAEQRHDIIPNRLALTAEESVSGVTGATAQVNQETPPMRIYIIGNDGITLCREPPATVNKGEVA